MPTHRFPRLLDAAYVDAISGQRIAAESEKSPPCLTCTTRFKTQQKRFKKNLPRRRGSVSSWGLAWAVWSTRSRSRLPSITARFPHFPRSTAISHRGRLVCGQLGRLARRGDGGPFSHVRRVFAQSRSPCPVRVMKRLVRELLVVSNACGGMNPYYRSGDIMVIEDHINLMGDNPLIGINDDRSGAAFPRHV